MSGIYVPKRAQGNSNALLSLAGAGAGALVGGPVGAGVGMSVGGMMGGMNQAAQPQGAGAVQTGPMMRRQLELESTPILQIQDSLKAVKEIEDPAQRMELAKPLLQADYMARKQMGGKYGG